MTQQRRECRVECRDAMDRPATMLVSVCDGQLTIVVPAGESARFGVDQIPHIQRLGFALAAGVSELRKVRFPRGLGRTDRL